MRRNCRNRQPTSRTKNAAQIERAATDFLPRAFRASADSQGHGLADARSLRPHDSIARDSFLACMKVPDLSARKTMRRSARAPCSDAQRMRAAFKQAARRDWRQSRAARRSSAGVETTLCSLLGKITSRIAGQARSPNRRAGSAECFLEYLEGDKAMTVVRLAMARSGSSPIA